MKEIIKQAKRLHDEYGVKYPRLILGMIVMWALIPLTLVNYLQVMRDFKTRAFTFDYSERAINALTCYVSNLPCCKVYAFITGIDIFRYAKDTMFR